MESFLECQDYAQASRAVPGTQTHPLDTRGMSQYSSKFMATIAGSDIFFYIHI